MEEGGDETIVETTAPPDTGSGGDDDAEAPAAGTPSGDCETDIAALEPIIEEKGLISNVTREESTYVTGLISHIGAYCSTSVADEFFARPEVEEFMSG